MIAPLTTTPTPFSGFSHAAHAMPAYREARAAILDRPCDEAIEDAGEAGSGTAATSVTSVTPSTKSDHSLVSTHDGRALPKSRAPIASVNTDDSATDGKPWATTPSSLSGSSGSKSDAADDE